VENRIPEWMFEILNKRCAGFREAEDLSFKARQEPTITGGERELSPVPLKSLPHDG
jgi:hypothetical protein